MPIRNVLAHITGALLATLLFVGGCSAQNDQQDARESIAVAQDQLALHAGLHNRKPKSCVAEGPKWMSFEPGYCGSNPASVNYMIYGGDGTYNVDGVPNTFGWFGDYPTVAPASYLQDMAVACDPFEIAINGDGPVTVTSDMRFTFWEISEQTFVKAFQEWTGSTPLTSFYLDHTGLQMLVDLWDCNMHGSIVCPPSVNPVTFTQVTQSRKYVASECKYSFTIATRR